MSKKQVYPKTTEQDIALPEKLLAKGNLPYKFAIRVRAVLCRAQKQPTGMIAEILHIMPTTVSQYVKETLIKARRAFNSVSFHFL